MRRPGWTAQGHFVYKPAPAPCGAQVAQLVEQRTENPRVGGSIPSLGTNIFKYLQLDSEP
jgi:hypothetical protein